jgi:aconitate hydratase
MSQKLNVTQKLFKDHLVSGSMNAGDEITIKIDQTLTQDATGTMVMIEFEAMNIPHVKTELSAQYVDHNLVQSDFKNPDDHIFLLTACKKFGVWFSRAGNGVSHPVHMERFGKPGKSLLGSDSHTPAAGSLGMLAMGAGGLEVALAMAGEPYTLNMPKVLGVKLTGSLPDWVSAKDIILEMLRRYNVDNCIGKVVEYYGSGLENLSAMDRHVIANMGTELGATTSIFPSDQIVKRFLKSQGRENDWRELKTDEDAAYDEYDEINLSELEPLIALPSSPGKVVPVKEVAGEKIYQSMIGSSANPGIRDFAIPALMLKDKLIADHVSLDINPTSRQILENLIELGLLKNLVHAGGRIHQAGCNGCIGMGQAPATGKISLRTVPRNFPGRSGTKEDAVYLCSPETAAASALKGVITDPRTMDFPYPKFKEPEELIINAHMLIPPLEKYEDIQIEKGPNIKPLPEFDPLPDLIEGKVLLKLGDDISTDEIMPAGSRVLPFRSNIPEISKFVFNIVDESFYRRAIESRGGGNIIIGRKNYGQGSSREHAAIAPRHLGIRVILAENFARIHHQNLANFGILPLEFNDPADWYKIEMNDVLFIEHIRENLKTGNTILIQNKTKKESYVTNFNLTKRQTSMILEGSLINLIRKEKI